MMHPLVDHAWLETHGASVVLADVRWYLDGRDGREAYEQGHLPGAVFIDLDECLSDASIADAGRHPLPSPERFADGMGWAGIGDDTVVVAYDDAGGVIAARLVWLLRATGHQAALLDGGLLAYEGPFETGPVTPSPTHFEPRPWPADRLATMADVTARQGVVLDARARDRYRGDAEPVDARAGHIPGAVNVPCREHLTDQGTFRPVEEIRKTFAEAGVVTGSSVVSYCGSGVTACHNLLALELAGFGNGRLFPGSWSQYAATDAPLSVGDQPG